MSLQSKIKTLLIRLWRLGRNTALAIFRNLVPYPLRQFVFKVLHWRERKVIVQNQELLRQLLLELQSTRDYRARVIFPPSLDWNVQLFQRPQQLAIALAKQGALVFYIQPKYDPTKPPFQLVGERLYICHVHVDTFQILPNPLIYLLTWNSMYASRFEHPRILYDYVDDIHAFYGDHRQILKGHRYLLKNAAYVLATARQLFDEVRTMRPDALFSPNGVVYEHFARAARREYSVPPPDMLPVLAAGNPVIGYYGALARWFDYDLLKELARLRPYYQFVLIGPDYDGTLELAGVPLDENIHWLGVKPYADLPHYLQYFDVAIIPFVVNDITNATSPLKLFEYMAGEKPIVITPMHETMHYPGVAVGSDPLQFAQQLDVALSKRDDQAYLSLLRQTARENTWERRADEILNLIEKKG
jgi:glycosyltransferase involved in cell wall biosynthesis